MTHRSRTLYAIDGQFQSLNTYAATGKIDAYDSADAKDAQMVAPGHRLWFMVRDSMTTALSDGATIYIGKHRFTREGALLKITSDGEMTLEQSYLLVAHLQTMFDENGYILILGDMTKGKGMQAEARKVASKWGQTYGVYCRTAVIGASFGVRTVIALMNRATNLLTRTPVYLEFFETEEEARRWLRAEMPMTEKGTRKDRT